MRLHSRAILWVLTLAGAAVAQDAVEVKTNDGATPTVRLSFTTGATADAYVQKARLRFDKTGSAGYLNLNGASTGTTAGDLRYSSGALLFHDGTAERTVVTTASNLWQDAGTYISALGNADARAYDSGQR